MAKKEKVSLVRSEAFESVDEALTAAMIRLDTTNERVGQLLNSDPSRTDLLPGMPDDTPEPDDTPRLAEPSTRRDADA